MDHKVFGLTIFPIPQLTAWCNSSRLTHSTEEAPTTKTRRERRWAANLKEGSTRVQKSALWGENKDFNFISCLWGELNCNRDTMQQKKGTGKVWNVLQLPVDLNTFFCCCCICIALLLLSDCSVAATSHAACEQMTELGTIKQSVSSSSASPWENEAAKGAPSVWRCLPSWPLKQTVRPFYWD